MQVYKITVIRVVQVLQMETFAKSDLLMNFLIQKMINKEILAAYIVKKILF